MLDLNLERGQKVYIVNEVKKSIEAYTVSRVNNRKRLVKVKPLDISASPCLQFSESALSLNKDRFIVDNEFSSYSMYLSKEVYLKEYEERSKLESKVNEVSSMLISLSLENLKELNELIETKLG